MKIAYVIPGSGGSFYCENCLRDSTVTGALERNGFQVTQIPMYLPLFRDGLPHADGIPIFYGAIGLYLRQRWPLFRRLPGSWDRIFNSRPLLSLASRMAGSTRAAGLEEMTVSMLQGEEGNQKNELERLVDWLAHDNKPDLVHLSNALLLGLARPLKERLSVPIVCTLQDEHTWIEPMREPNRRRVWALLREKAVVVDRFIAVSEYYKGVMAEKLNLPVSRLEVIPLGVDPAGYRPRRMAPVKPVIGFLSRITEGSGLPELIEALWLLVRDYGRTDVGLIVYGGMTGDDLPYLRFVRKMIHTLSLEKHVTLSTAYDRRRRFEFLRDISVLSVPRRTPEAFGMFILEALASGVPVVQPDIGAFPEIIRATKGGLLYPSGDVSALARALFRILTDVGLAEKTAALGWESVRTRFSIAQVAAQTGGLYRSLAGC